MSEVDDRYVNRGFWLNVEQGTILGRTLTVDSRTGTIIVALLAVMASLATTHLWNIVAFSYHQFRASGGPRDAFFQQQQVLLRTLAPPGSFIADCVKLWWLWRKRQNHAFKRSIAQVIVAMTFVATTIAVGVFSSYVASSTNLQILVHNPQCRPLDLDPTLDTFMQHQLNLSAYEIDVTSRSKPFAEECYQNKTSLSARCMAFIQPNIPLEAERTDCPFDTKVCAAEDLGVSVDSGLVDGNHIFGWNMHAGDRVKFRRKVTCGILRQEGYTEIINASDWPDLGRSPIPGETLEIARYGSKRKTSLGDNITFVNSLVKVNLTTKYSTA